MGTSKKLHAKLTKMAIPLKLPTGLQRGRADMPSVQKLIKEGLDPIHAVFGNDPDGLHRLLKYGPDRNYWNEFVFKGYHHYQGEAICLAGIPDLKATLPHA